MVSDLRHKRIDRHESRHLSDYSIPLEHNRVREATRLELFAERVERCFVLGVADKLERMPSLLHGLGEGRRLGRHLLAERTPRIGRQGHYTDFGGRWRGRWRGLWRGRWRGHKQLCASFPEVANQKKNDTHDNKRGHRAKDGFSRDAHYYQQQIMLDRRRFLFIADTCRT